MADLMRAATVHEDRRARDEVGDAEGTPLWPPPLQPNLAPPSDPLNAPAFQTSALPSLLPSSSVDALPPHHTLRFITPPAPQLAAPTAACASEAPASGALLSAHVKKQREGKKARQAKHREKAKSEQVPWTYTISPALSSQWVQPHAMQVRWATSLLTYAHGAFIGIRQTHDRSKPWTLPELKELGFRLIEWDGWYVYLSNHCSSRLTRATASPMLL